MEETTPTFIQEYFGEYGIMGSIIVILLFIIGFLYLRQKYPKMTLTKEAPEETPAEEPEPEPLLIHCPACGTEVSRYAALNADIRYAQPNQHTMKPLSMSNRKRKKTEAVVYGLYWD